MYRRQIAILYDGELQMIEQTPRLIRKVPSEELKTALELHLAETREQAARLKMMLEGMGEQAAIALYNVAAMLAGMLDHPQAATLLRKSLKEEQETATDLGQIGESIVMGEEIEDAILEEAVPHSRRLNLQQAVAENAGRCLRIRKAADNTTGLRRW